MDNPMHWKRWLTALVLIPILITIIFKGGTLTFALLTAIVGMIALREYFFIVFKNNSESVPQFYFFWGCLSGTLLVVAAAFQSWTGIMGALFVNLIGIAGFSVFHFKHTDQAPLVIVKQVFGVIYIYFLLGFAVLIHAGTQGPYWLFFVIWVIAWGDSGALYTGSYLGKHKLCPAVSPKKTIEGAVGGLLANLIFAVLYKMFIFNALPVSACLFFAIAGGVLGQFGDLFESEFKRAAGVKDSGKLLPGHGGFLDRIDALLFATPLAYFLKAYLMP